MRNAHLMIKTIMLIRILITTHADIDVLNANHNDPIHLSFSAGSPQLLISVAIMNSLIIEMMIKKLIVVNLEVNGSVSVLIKDPEQLVQVLLPSCPLARSS